MEEPVATAEEGHQQEGAPIDAGVTAPVSSSRPASSMWLSESSLASRYVAEIKDDEEMTARVPCVFTLLRCGCCELCAMRFLGQRSFSLYREPIPVLRRLIEALWESLPEEHRGGSDGEDWRSQMNSSEESVCTACLGALPSTRSNSFMASLTDALSGGMSQYEFSNYSLTITLPASTVSRHYALHYHLLDVHKDLKVLQSREWENDVVDIKEAMKWVLGYELRQRMNMHFSRNALFHASIKYKHAETETEHEVLYQIPETNLRPRKQQVKSDNEDASITAVSKALRNLPKETYRKYASIPPVRVATPAIFEFSFFHDSIYISGRYAKFSRELSQSPWNVGDARVSETSVQELVTGPLQQYYQAQEMRFSSSGREDIDVRMLGEGRPFVLEIVNPHRTKFSVEDYAKMQSEINAATHLIRVRDLQLIRKEDVPKVTESSEEGKRKSYRCVVWVAKRITPADIEFLAKTKDLVIDQNTPIRVLHRRTLCVRKRTIYSMRATYWSPHFFTLDLVTQAGTYIKEFIHGDLGRTTPNLGELLDCDVDILQLDVLAVDLDFPPRLPNQPPIPSYIEAFDDKAEDEKEKKID